MRARGARRTRAEHDIARKAACAVVVVALVALLASTTSSRAEGEGTPAEPEPAAKGAAQASPQVPDEAAGGSGPTVRVGSKVFTESVVLAEMVAQVARGAGSPAVHTRQLGGTTILWNALLAGQIDVYPEYTGTITQEILSKERIEGEDALRAALAQRGVTMSRSLGFNDTYALGMKEETAARLNVRTISDLRAHPELAIGFSGIL